MNNKYLFLVVIIINIITIEGSKITSPKSAKRDIFTYDAHLGMAPNNTIMEVIMSLPYELCDQIDSSKNYTNKIVIVGPNSCLPQEKVTLALQMNASAVLIEQYKDTPGLLCFYQNGKTDHFDIPILEISKTDIEIIRNILITNQTVFINLSIDPNPIISMGNAIWIFFTIFFSIYDLFLITYISRKIFLFYYIGDKTSKLAIFILSLDLVICFLRIPILIDPTGLLGIYNWIIIEVFMTIDFGLTTAATLVIALIWDSLYYNAMKMNKYSNRIRTNIILVSIISAILILLELITNILNASFIHTELLTKIKIIFILISGITVAGYFFITGRRVIKMGSNKNKKKNRNLSMGKIIILCAIFLCFYVITISLILTSIYKNPLGYFLLRFFPSFWMYNITLTHILLFIPSKGNKTSEINNFNLDTS